MTIFAGCACPTPQYVAIPGPPGTSAVNPAMSYNVTLGTPTAQGLTPQFTGLPCIIYEINGAGPSYGWNSGTQSWMKL